MNTDKEIVEPPRFAKLSWVHWLVMASSVFLTLLAWYISKSQHEERIREQFLRESQQLVDLIHERMKSYSDSLRAGVALYNTHKYGLTYPEWHIFANSLNLKDKYPGINGIGVIYNVKPSELDSFLREQRKLRPNFSIHPPSTDDIYLPITYVVPVAGNMEAVGLDVSQEEHRLEAALKARDQGRAQITAPIVLVQDQMQTPGFLFYSPFYHDNKRNTLEERRENFKGMVYAPFIVSKLIYGVLEQQQRLINVEISDQNEVLYSEHKSAGKDPLFKRLVNLDLYGRTWTFDLRTNRRFEGAASSNQPNIILFGGFIIDFLLFSLFMFMSRSNAISLRLAKTMSYEAELQRKSAAQASRMAALGEMAGGIAHEINNPLSVILTYSNLLQDLKDSDQLSESPEMMNKATEKIESSVKRIATIVEGFRTFSRDGAKDTFALEEINALVRDTIEFAQEGFAKKDVELRFHSGEEALIECQKVQISQVLINLLNNAKFAAAESEEKLVEVSIDACSSKEVPSKKVARISVSNSGEIIPQDVADKIFEPFFTTKGPGEGTGLGLSISKGIVEAHDGKLVLDPSQTRTTFVIELPIASMQNG